MKQEKQFIKAFSKQLKTKASRLRVAMKNSLLQSSPQINIDGLEFEILMEIDYTGVLSPSSFRVITNEKVILQTFDFLKNIPEFSGFIHKQIELANLSLEKNGQILKAGKIILTVDDNDFWGNAGFYSVYVILTTNEGANKEFRYDTNILFTSFSYDKSTTIKGRELKLAIEKDRLAHYKMLHLAAMVRLSIILVPLIILFIGLLHAYQKALAN